VARRLLLFLFSIAILAPSPAAAWWDYPHKVIARIAMLEVSLRTRREVARLLRHARALDTPGCPAGTIEDASIWPDCIRRLEDRFSYTARWHFQNVSICRPFDQGAACPDGNCVSAQIERNLRMLKDRELPLRERLAALAFLVHFVGDLHQPMHAADRGDGGGSRLPAHYGRIRTNLHIIWDGYLAERAITTPEAGAAGLLRELSSQDRAEAVAGTVTDWARQSWELGRNLAYGGLLAEPCADLPGEPPTLTEAQVQVRIPLVRRQVAYAGLRLARLLDEAFAPGASPETGTGARPRRPAS
jgi:hypothetical protein